MDYHSPFVDNNVEYDYDSSKKGGNRYATILLYMTDLDEKDGGETVFVDAWPTGQNVEDRKPIETVTLSFLYILYERVCSNVPIFFCRHFGNFESRINTVF
jgi:hypothetical protein